jgi:hypothetical protein
MLNVPAVQLVKKEGVRKIFETEDRQSLIVTAHRWLLMLP